MRWFVVAGLLVAIALLGPSTAGAASCSRAEADTAARMQLLPYADAHDKGLFDDFGGVEQMGYERGLLECRDLTGDGSQEMIVHMQCCTGGSPSPWGIFKHDPSGGWVLAYARAVDTVFRLQFRGRAVRAMQPAPYEGACTRFVRFRIVTWSGSRFRSRLTHRTRPARSLLSLRFRGAGSATCQQT
jgi:hypothetical protein